eukprot:g8277.t1
MIEGESAGLAEAIDRSVQILKRSVNPLIFGLSRSSTLGQRAAVELAERLGANIDTTASVCHGPSIMAIQQVGESTCSLGEIRNRSDLVIFWGANPVESHPRHFERYSVEPSSEFLPGGHDDRTIVVVDTKPTATSDMADLFLRVKPERDFEVFWLLRQLIRGDEPEFPVDTGLSLDTLRDLARRMTSCRYGAVFFGLGLAQRGLGHLTVDALLRLVADLNSHTRFVTRRLRLPGDVTGADTVLCWQTGYPFAVNLSRDFPRYNPGEFSADEMLRRHEVDACVLIGSESIEMLSPAARDALRQIPTIVLDYPQLADEFLERHRRGEFPSIEEYATAHPDLADEIRDLFPTIAELEGFKQRVVQSGEIPASQGSAAIERLADFRIIREVGRGGMGIVYEAEQESLGRRVAVKVLPRQTLLKPRQLARFQREARTAARLHHTHIVPVFGVGEDDGHHFIVMQLIPGVGLDEVLRELRRFESDSSKDPGRVDDERPASHVARSLLSGRANVLPTAADSDTHESVSTSHDSLTAGDSANGSTPSNHRGAFDDARTVRVDPIDDDDIDEPIAQNLLGGHLRSDYWHNIGRIGRDAADALEYAHHSGTLHRDVKPGNLLVDVRGEVWVADFGLAKATEGDQVSQTGDVVGTLRYMAPEQLRDAADARSDVYGLGLTLYELATLRPAFDQQACRRAIMHHGDFGEPTPPRRLVEHIPRDLETIILTAIAPEPERRYQTAGELAADLERFLEDRPIRARRVRWYEHLWRWSRRNRSVAALSAVAVLLLIAIAAVSSTAYYRTEKAHSLAQKRLIDEREQRKRAEGTLTISLEALDAVYRSFAPERRAATETLSLLDGDEEQTVSAQPVLAPEHAKVLENLLVYYDRLAKFSSGNVTLREEAAKANRRIGDIHQRLGDPESAQSAFQRAATMYTGLLSEITDASQRASIELELARIDIRLGEVARASHAGDDARNALHAARERLERLTPAAAVQFELARTYFLLAARPEHGPGGRGRSDHRPGEFDRPDNGGEERGRRPGGRFRSGRRSGGRHRDGGRSGIKRSPDRGRMPPPGRFRNQPENPKRSEYLDKAIAILDALHNSHPKVGEYQHWLALVLRERSGKPDSSDYNRAVTLLEELTERFPHEPDYRYSLAETLSRGAEPHRFAPGDEENKTEERLRKAYEAIRVLAGRQSNIPAYALLYASVAHRLAMTLEKRNRRTNGTSKLKPKIAAEIAEYHKVAEAAQAKLVKRYPQVVPYAIWLSKIRTSRARFLTQTNRLYSAYDTLGLAGLALKSIPEQHPALRFLQVERRYAYTELATAFESSGDTESSEAAIKAAVEGTSGHWPVWLLIWVSGTALIAVSAVVRLAQCLRAAKRAGWRRDADLESLAAELAVTLKLKRRVRVVVTNSRLGPAVVGLFRPLILLPEVVVRDRTPADLKPILMHELVHIRRGDLWVGLLQVVASALWWFHPLVWICGRLVSREAERCCDEESIAALGGDTARYAYSLLDVLDLKQSLKPVPSFPGVRPVEVTSQRLERIMSLRQGCRKQTPWWCRLCTAALAIAVLPGAALIVSANGDPADDGPLKRNRPAAVHKNAESSQMIVQTYPVADLLRNLIVKHGLSEAAARDIVKQTVMSSCVGRWDRKPGVERSRRNAGSAQWFLTDLVVRQHAGQLRKIEKAITQMRKFGFEETKLKVRIISNPPADFETRWNVSRVEVEPNEDPTTAVPGTLASSIRRPLPGKNAQPRSNAQMSVETSLPVVYEIMDTARRDAAIQKIQGNTKSTMLMVPTASVFNGRTVAIADVTQRPFVVGIQDGKPKLRVVTEGLQVRLRPLKRQNGAIWLDFEVMLSDIQNVKLTTLRLADRKEPITLQSPTVARIRLESSVLIQPGKTLLIGGLKPTNQKGESETIWLMIEPSTFKLRLKPASTQSKKSAAVHATSRIPQMRRDATKPAMYAKSDAASVRSKLQPFVVKTQAQAKAVGRIVALGGEVVSGEHQAERFVVVHLKGKRFGDADLAHVHALPGPVSLILSDTNITDAGLAQCVSKLRIGWLSVSRHESEDVRLSGRTHIFQKQICLIDGTGPLTTVAALQNLARQSQTTTLLFQNIAANDDVLKRVASLKQLERLSLDVTRAKASGLKHLALLPKLRELSLSGPKLADGALLHFVALKQLRKLYLSHGRVSDDAVHSLRELLPNCRIVVNQASPTRARAVSAYASGDKSKRSRYWSAPPAAKKPATWNDRSRSRRQSGIRSAPAKSPAHKSLIVKNYPVADLVVPVPGSVQLPAKPAQPRKRAAIEIQPLIKLIQTRIAPKSWGPMEAQGTIRSFEKTLSLVVRQTADVHQQIAELLTRLRRLQDVQVTLAIQTIEVPQSDPLCRRFQGKLSAADRHQNATLLAPADLKTLMASVTKSKESKTLQSIKVTLFRNQAVEIPSGLLTEGERKQSGKKLQIASRVSEDRRTIRLQVALDAANALDALAKGIAAGVPDGRTVLIDADDLIASQKIPLQTFTRGDVERVIGRATLGYGWQSGTIDARNRSASFGDDLSRDFNFTRQGTFAVDVPENGTYDITLVMGDGVGFMRDQMGISLEGQLVDSVTASGGNFAVNTYRVTVTDGQLNVLFQDLGGSDPLVMINAMDVVLVDVPEQDQTGPQIVSIETGDTGDGTIDRFLVTFSEDIDPTSVSLNAVNLYGPNGFVAAVSVNMIDAVTVEFVYPPLTAGGTYTFTVIPSFTDLSGNFVDQDGDGIGGEFGDDFETFDVDVEPTVVPPIADAGGGYKVVEGGTVQLVGSNVGQNNGSRGNVTFTWDLDGDGIFGETGSDAAFGDEVGVNPNFSAAGLAAGTTVTVTLRVTDDSGNFSDDTATVEVQNVAPEFSSLKLKSRSWFGRSVVVVKGTFTDASVGDAHVVTVDWGDGTSSALRVRNRGDVSRFFGGHRYRSGGQFEVRVTITDSQGASTTSVQSVTVPGIRVENGTLHITGSDRNDRIVVQRVRRGYFKITANFLPRGYQYVRARGIDRIDIDTHGGNDRVKIVGRLGVDVDFDGGEGNDRIDHRRDSCYAARYRCFSSHSFRDLLLGLGKSRARCR